MYRRLPVIIERTKRGNVFVAQLVHHTHDQRLQVSAEMQQHHGEKAEQKELNMKIGLGISGFIGFGAPLAMLVNGWAGEPLLFGVGVCACLGYSSVPALIAHDQWKKRHEHLNLQRDWANWSKLPCPIRFWDLYSRDPSVNDRFPVK